MIWLRVLGAQPAMPGDLGPARVTWVRHNEAAVRFLSGAIGRGVLMKVLQRVDSMWESANAVSHATTCYCDWTGAVYEPRETPAWKPTRPVGHS